MSRGPGRWQRLVLELAAAAPLGEDGLPTFVFVDDVLSVAGAADLPPKQHLDGKGCPGATQSPETTFTRSEREAVRRAMRTLARHGHGTLWTVRRTKQTRQYTLCRPVKADLCHIGFRRHFTPAEELAHARIELDRHQKLAQFAVIGGDRDTIRHHAERATELDRLIRRLEVEGEQL